MRAAACAPAGKIVEGDDVVRKMESMGSNSGATKLPVKISACGKL
jgi:hypothetical protein